MKNLFKITLLLICFILYGNLSFAAGVTTPTTPAAPAKKPVIETPYMSVQSPVIVVNNPFIYLSKDIQFTAVFNKFSTLGLGYSGAMREPQAYIGILINRDDVGSNIIPLSEFKMFIKRSDAEKLTDLESGDKILIKGHVFSAALGDPWMDIAELKVLTEKTEKQTKK